jgi:hypothetical protein
VCQLLLQAAVAIALGACVGAGSGRGTTEPPAAGPSATHTFVLTVLNVDGPESNILIGDRKVATLNCWDHAAKFSPGELGLPSLPWTVTILDISHSPKLKTLGIRTETAHGPSDTIVIRADHIEDGPMVSSVASPIASCPPPPSAEILY